MLRQPRTETTMPGSECSGPRVALVPSTSCAGVYVIGLPHPIFLRFPHPREDQSACPDFFGFWHSAAPGQGAEERERESNVVTYSPYSHYWFFFLSAFLDPAPSPRCADNCVSWTHRRQNSKVEKAGLLPLLTPPCGRNPPLGFLRALTPFFFERSPHPTPGYGGSSAPQGGVAGITNTHRAPFPFLYP